MNQIIFYYLSCFKSIFVGRIINFINFLSSKSKNDDKIPTVKYGKKQKKLCEGVYGPDKGSTKGAKSSVHNESLIFRCMHVVNDTTKHHHYIV